MQMSTFKTRTRIQTSFISGHNYKTVIRSNESFTITTFFAIAAFAWNSVKRQKRLPSEFVKNEYEYNKRRLKPRTRFYKYN